MQGRISTAELAQRLDEPNFTVIDVRPMAAYNGWRLRGEARRGHIQGAIACPLLWLEKVNRADLFQILEAKGITRAHTIVVYGYQTSDSAAMVSELAELGYHRVLQCEADVMAWATDERLPMARLARYEKLVHPEWVHRLINHRKPETYAGNDFAIFHVNLGAPDEYKEGHLPGAIHLDTGVLESSSDWNRRPASELVEAMQAHGVTHDKTIVLYGRDSPLDPAEHQPGRGAGQTAAARAAVILMYAGVRDVRLLDGGLDAWVTAGYAVDTEDHRPSPVPEFGIQAPRHPEYFIDLPGAKALLTDPSAVLVSIRTWDEFIGKTSGYDYIDPTGRIPGSVWGNSGTDAYHMQHYRNIDNTMRVYHEIEANWLESGIRADKKVAFYCGTGWRASEAFFYAYLMGWPNISVYDGGWFEWSRTQPDMIETGVPDTEAYDE